ncbi:MAG: flagellar biosynthetic protein FliR [Micrococcales bacterium 70-64]|nr:flagellar biosynthetic protein FliR [Leifsonia sp.]ODU65441.1 MAG: flagellar biosynthetic protein FliR [Leifsonia sp. SCN 70-46]OJX87187.1 MAG: flagellar biosynthetic protein FliR [Micrococcales bacterium 70-64]
MLAGVRLTAFLVIAPPFSFAGIPARIKAMLGIGLAIAVAPRVTQGYTTLDTGPFLVAIVMQLIVGLFLGFLVMMAFSAVQSAGNLIDLFGGFQLAQAFDPQSLVNGAQFTRLFHMAALALLFSTDGYQLILAGLMRSFDAIPVNLTLSAAPNPEILVTAFSQLFLSALQIAGPMIIVLFLADVGLGLLTRVAPAINAFALGFPLKILITVVFAGVVFLALPRVVSAITQDVLQAMLGAFS